MEDERIPLLLVAGALGAGKTTLLGRWIAEPAFAGTALVVNELGDVPVDAHLVGAFAGTVRSVAGGCACCAVRGELARTLEAVVSARGARARCTRVAVELGGLGHPAPLLADLAHPVLGGRFALQGVVTMVDASAAPSALDEPEARAQVEAADVVLVSKAHLAASDAVQRLIARVAQLNPDAEILAADADAASVWDAAERAPGRARRHVAAAYAFPTDVADVHSGAVASHTLRLAAPVELSEFCVRLASFLDLHAAQVLRVKGLVAVRGRRGPAVIQAVGPSLQPVRTLKEWPADARPGGLLVVARGLDAAALAPLAAEASRST